MAFDPGARPMGQIAITAPGMSKGQHLLPEGGVVLLGAAYVGPLYERAGLDQRCQESLSPDAGEELFRTGRAIDDDLFPELRVSVAP